MRMMKNLKYVLSVDSNSFCLLLTNLCQISSMFPARLNGDHYFTDDHDDNHDDDNDGDLVLCLVKRAKCSKMCFVLG